MENKNNTNKQILDIKELSEYLGMEKLKYTTDQNGKDSGPQRR